MVQSQFNWQPVGSISPMDLVTARRQAHNGAQFVARAGKYLLSAKEDDSHTSMEWDSNLSLFRSDFIGQKNRLSVGFDTSGLSLVFINEMMQKIWQLDLHDRTANKILDLLRNELSNYGFESTQLGLALHYEIPDALADDEPFTKGNLKDLEELTRYFSNADAALRSISQQYEHTAAVRCWPHHFDIATLIKLDPNITSEHARSVGIGLSPGDSGYPQPYFYVNMWPYPDIKNQNLPSLPGGNWHTQDWIGAVLTADEIVKHDSQAQQSLVDNFLTSAITNATKLLAK